MNVSMVTRSFFVIDVVFGWRKTDFILMFYALVLSRVCQNALAALLLMTVYHLSQAVDDVHSLWT